jgi:hypothetical protein
MDDTTAAAYATIHAEAVRRHHRNTHVVRGTPRSATP